MNDLALSIVIPAYCERDKIVADVRAAHAFVHDRLGGSGEILVVDDGSTDDTADVARSVTDVEQLTVLRHEPKRGKGYALRAGIAKSRGRRVLLADAGGCVPFEDALAGLALLDRGAHCAHGSRRAAGARVLQQQPPHRRIGSRVFRTLLRAGMGVPGHLTDTQCGFKLYDGDVSRRLYAECFTNGFMLDVEVIRRAAAHGLTLAEFPVHWHADLDTHFRVLCGSARNLAELARIRLRVQRG